MSPWTSVLKEPKPQHNVCTRIVASSKESPIYYSNYKVLGRCSSGKGGHTRKKWEYDAAQNQRVYDMEPLLHFLKLHSSFESNTNTSQ